MVYYPDRKRPRLQRDVPPPPPSRPNMSVRLKHHLISPSTIEILTHSWRTKQQDGTYCKMWLQDPQPITPAYVPKSFDILGEKLDKAFLLDDDIMNDHVTSATGFLSDVLFDDDKWEIDTFQVPLPESLELKPLFEKGFTEDTVVASPPPPPPPPLGMKAEAIGDQLENSQHSPTHTANYDMDQELPTTDPLSFSSAYHHYQNLPTTDPPSSIYHHSPYHTISNTSTTTLSKTRKSGATESRPTRHISSPTESRPTRQVSDGYYSPTQPTSDERFSPGVPAQDEDHFFPSKRSRESETEKQSDSSEYHSADEDFAPAAPSPPTFPTRDEDDEDFAPAAPSPPTFPTRSEDDEDFAPAAPSPPTFPIRDEDESPPISPARGLSPDRDRTPTRSATSRGAMALHADSSSLDRTPQPWMSDTGIPPHTQPISTRSTPHTQTLLQTPTPQAHPSLSRRTVRLPLNSPATPLYLGTAVRSPRDYTPSLRREAATNEQSYTPTYTPSNRDPRIRRSLTRNSLGLDEPPPPPTTLSDTTLTPRQRIVESAAQKIMEELDLLDSQPMDIDYEDSAESSSRAPPQRMESSETITSSPQRMVSSETIRSSELDGEVLDGEEIDELINKNEEQRVVSPSDEVIMIMSEDEEEEDIVDVKAAVTELDQFAEDIDSPDELDEEEEDIPEKLDGEMNKSRISLFRDIITDTGEVTKVLYFRKSKFRVTGTAQHQLDKMRMKMDYKDACKRTGLPTEPNKQLQRPADQEPSLSTRIEDHKKKTKTSRRTVVNLNQQQPSSKRFGVPLTNITRQVRVHDEATALKMRNFGIPLRQIRGPLRQISQGSLFHLPQRPQPRVVSSAWGGGGNNNNPPPPPQPAQPLHQQRPLFSSRNRNLSRSENLLSAFCPCWVQRPFHDTRCAQAHDKFVELVMDRQHLAYPVVKQCVKQYFMATSTRSGDPVKDFMFFKDIVGNAVRGSG